MTDEDLPALYQAADRSSIAAQKSFLWVIRLRLFGILGAAFFGLFVWKSHSSPVDWAGALAACLFAMTLVIEAYLYQTKPERTWYEARATAESVKTLSWRYAVGGEPFNIGMGTEAQVADLFLHRLTSLFEVVKDLDLTPPSSVKEQITRQMRSLRAASLADRKAAYERDRVESQQDWYQRKAILNKRHASGWTKVMLGTEIAGTTCAILKAVGVIAGDILSFTGVIVAAIVCA